MNRVCVVDNCVKIKRIKFVADVERSGRETEECPSLSGCNSHWARDLRYGRHIRAGMKLVPRYLLQLQ